MTSKRQRDSRARRGCLIDVIHGESEPFPYASRKKPGEQPALFVHTNWVAGEHGDALPIVPDTSDTSLKALPLVVHKPLVVAGTLDVMRQRIRCQRVRLSWMGSASGAEQM
jgi:hypothetical protein